MVRRFESNPIDRDEQLGEAIEVYLAEAEAGTPPDPDAFAARYPDLSDDLRAALDGLALVRGLVGESAGPGHRLESGRRIAGYRIVRELGRGGMGTVYEAVHVGLDRPVALKVLGTHAAPDSTGRRRFLNEARTAAGLHHTHIVPVFDVGQVGGLCYYAMQRIEGSGLDKVLRHLRRDRQIAAGSSTGGTTPASRPRAPSRGSNAQPEDTITWIGRSGTDSQGGHPPGLARDDDDEPPPYDPPRGSAYYRWVAEVGREAAEALSHAHRRGIIHRDVKPSNLLVDSRGVVWVADFGLARRLADPALTHHDSLLGTPRYMSPEQARTGPIDGRTDVYSLGATLYELLTLRPPFEGKTAAELVEQIRDSEPDPLRLTDPRIPRDLETIVLKALAKRPADRYASAAELAEDLERYLHHEPVHARRIGPLGRAWRYARRHPGLTVVSTVAAATVLAIATAAYVRVVQERDQTRVALKRMEDANKQTETANKQAQREARERLLSMATVTRHTRLPNRRADGLLLLKKAAELGPEPALRAKLRDEAIEFLVLRDVEARPEFATGPARGVVFSSEGTRLATISENGEEFSLWEVAGRKRVERHLLGSHRAEPPPAGAAGRAGGAGRARGPWAAITAVGECAVVSLPDGSLHLFDLATGAPIRDETLGDGRRILSLAAAPGGHRLVTTEFVPFENPNPAREGSARGAAPRGDGPRGEYQVRLYDLASFDRPIKILYRAASSPRDAPMMIAISPDGERVATARHRETTVSLWSTEDGEPIGEPLPAQAELTALALGPDGLLAAAGGGLIRFWDVDSRTPLPSATPYQGSYVRHLRFNPKGTLLAVAGGLGAGVELWALPTHTLVAVLPAPYAAQATEPNVVEDLAFSPDGKTLVAANSATTTSVWAIIDPLVRAQISGFDASPTSLAFAGDERLAMGTSRGTIRVWSPGQCPSTTRRVEAAPPPAASADRMTDDRAVPLTFDGQDRLIAVDPLALTIAAEPRMPGDWRPPRLPGPSMFAPPMARASRAQSLFVASGPQILGWDPKIQPERWQRLRIPRRPDSAEARSGRDRGRRDAPRREPFFSWRQLAASPDGGRLYLLDSTESLRVVDRDARGNLKAVDWNFHGRATCLALGADGSLLALGDRQGNVTLLDTDEGIVQAELSRPNGTVETPQIWTLAFSPDGRELAVGLQQGTIEIWSTSNPIAPLVHLPGHRGAIVSTLAYDREGHHLASGGRDKIVEVWDLERVRNELEPLGLAW